MTWHDGNVFNKTIHVFVMATESCKELVFMKSATHHLHGRCFSPCLILSAVGCKSPNEFYISNGACFEKKHAACFFPAGCLEYDIHGKKW